MTDLKSSNFFFKYHQLNLLAQDSERHIHQTPIPEAKADSYIASKNDQTSLHVYLKYRRDKLKSGKKKMDVKYRFRADGNFTKKKQNSGVTIF